MAQPHPNVPGFAKTAKSALLVLEEKLHESDILSFPWPQDLDSGIDMVSFASIPDGAATLATAFVAGFQSKGTSSSFRKAGSSRVEIGNHRAYWTDAPLPVFVVNTSLADRDSLVEDVAPGLRAATASGHLSIEVRVPIEAVSADIRMRMYSHALAPWMSPRIRHRALSDVPQRSGLDQNSSWSVLGWAMSTDSDLQPKSWMECVQYFSFLRWVFRGSSDRDQLRSEANRPPAQGEFAHLYSVLLHSLETLAEFNRQRPSMPHEATYQTDISFAKAVVKDLWDEARNASGISFRAFARRVRKGSPALPTADTPKLHEKWEPEYLLQRLIDGDPLDLLMDKALNAAFIERRDNVR